MSRYRSTLLLALTTLAASSAHADSSRIEALRARLKAGRAEAPKAPEAPAPAAKVAAEKVAAATEKALTREERRAAEQRVQAMMRALENGDEVAFTQALAGDFSQDRSTIENALRRDEQSQSEVRLEVFFRQVRVSGDTVSVQFDWNRQAQDIRSGTPDGTQGTAIFFLHRDGMKVTRFQGPLPFGVRDRNLVQQAGGERARQMGDGQMVKLSDGH